MPVAAWLDSFHNRVADATIEIEPDSHECAIDWEEGPDESAWERATKEHQEIDPEKDD